MIKSILIVGLGSIGKRHLRLARELFPQAKIAVLRHQANKIVPEYADYIFSTMNEALAFSPQVAVISNPATFHISSAMPLAKAGAHLLIEKPLSASTEGVAELLNACERSGAQLLTGYNLRFLPSLQQFKAMLDTGVIGALWSVRSEIGQYLPSWRTDTDYRQGVSAQHALGGGALLELSHELDYLLWIFGEVDWVQGALTQQSDLEIDVEDSAHLSLGFRAKGTENPLVATVNLDFIRHDTTRSCIAIGKLGSLRWNGVIGTVELWAPSTQAWREIYHYKATRDESYIKEWKDFASCLDYENAPCISGEDGFKVLRIIEAARLAAKTGSRVKVASI
jgi:predicted dehydrogenase